MRSHNRVVTVLATVIGCHVLNGRSETGAGNGVSTNNRTANKSVPRAAVDQIAQTWIDMRC
jgi:hypothetical protein